MLNHSRQKSDFNNYIFGVIGARTSSASIPRYMAMVDLNIPLQSVNVEINAILRSFYRRVITTKHNDVVTLLLEHLPM